MSLSRRHFLQRGGAFALGFGGLYSFLGGRTLNALGGAGRFDSPFGPLVRDPEGIFDLPEGFRYTILSRHGDPMDDGLVVPHRPDGMATFPGPDGLTILVRNHEVNAGAPLEEGAFGTDLAGLEGFDLGLFYDAGEAAPALGGTTTVLFDTHSQTVVRQYLSLAGTLRNCAGGPTPWGSWITCEETTVRAGEGLLYDHGYNFEVPARADVFRAEPVPLKAMGRFNHEAVAVDPATGIVYQTEDAHDGLLYRFLPHTPEKLQDGGRLQALAVEGSPSFDTRNWEDTTVRPGDRLPVRWLDLEHVEAPDDDLRLRGFEAGATRFARGEGMWYGNGAVYFACTNGGTAKKGQIWRYHPGEGEGTAEEMPGTLELFVEPNDGQIIDNADNLTVAPWGDLIVCEDGGGEQFLLGVTPAGDVYSFGRNARSNSELAGAAFSPDGSTLFVNLQMDGLTLAITGPWNG